MHILNLPNRNQITTVTSLDIIETVSNMKLKNKYTWPWTAAPSQIPPDSNFHKSVSTNNSYCVGISQKSGNSFIQVILNSPTTVW